MSLRNERVAPRLGIIEPCLPSPAKAPPSGAGCTQSSMTASAFSLAAIARAFGSLPGNEFSHRSPFIGMAVGKLPLRSCLIDGEAIVCDENGLAVFEKIRRHGALASAVLCAFDLLELDGRDLRREPIEKRKALLAKLLNGQQMSIVLNEHFEEDGGLSARLRRDCLEAPRANVSSGPLAALGEGQEPESASREAGSRRGLELTDQ